MGQSNEMQIQMRERENPTLYQITEYQREIIYKIEDAGGEITPEMNAELLITEKQLQSKSIAYLEVIRTKEAFNLLIDNEIKRLQLMKKVNNNTVERLNDNLLLAVKTFGDFTVGTQKFGTRKSTSVRILNEDEIPSEFLKTTVTTAPDKNRIAEVLKAGGKVEGAKLSNNLNLKIN